MKILQIGKFYPIRGGVEKVMYDIMLGLSERGVACDMLCAANEDVKPGIHPINEYARLICVPVVKKMAATMVAPSMISTLKKIQGEYDVIHIHHPDPMACLALFFSGYKGKVVLHWHSDILKQRMLLKMYLPFQNWMLKRADFILGTTPVYVDESRYLQLFKRKIGYVPIGVDPICPDSDKVANLKARFAGKKIIFSLGRLVEYKGYEFLVKAASYLPDDYVVLIGGNGPLRAYLLSLINSLQLENKVKLMGFLPDEELPTYFGACDLFSLSSIMKTEAFAIVQIEAMSCGKPVVSTRIKGSGVSWVNEDGVSGLTVEPENEKALAEAIVRILEDPDYHNTLSDNALTRFDTLFTRERMVKNCLKVYEKVLGETFK